MAGLLLRFHDLVTSQKGIYVVGGVVVTVVSAVIIKKLLHKEEKIYPRDTVILHQIGRGPYAPSLSPFVMKIETYLRMAEIPYQNVHAFAFGPKGKFPWIEYNGETVADTTHCINFLNKKLGIDFNKHLSPAEKGIAESMKVLAEEHLYWLLILIRWQFGKDISMVYKALNLNMISFRILRRGVRKQLWYQGLGRHTEGEITQITMKDLQSVSDFLGEKKFLMGDDPSEVDCTMFGQLSYYYWHLVGTVHETLIKDNYPNLAAYCERMKATFWPDWDQCITHGSTRKATK